MQIRFVDIEEDDLLLAVKTVSAFKKDHPDRPMGFRQGVIYHYYQNYSKFFYVYKTKYQLVVRGNV